MDAASAGEAAAALGAARDAVASSVDLSSVDWEEVGDFVAGAVDEARAQLDAGDQTVLAGTGALAAALVSGTALAYNRVVFGGYAGDLTPQQAVGALEDDPAALLLVDVRTLSEREAQVRADEATRLPATRARRERRAPTPRRRGCCCRAGMGMRTSSTAVCSEGRHRPHGRRCCAPLRAASAQRRPILPSRRCVSTPTPARAIALLC